MSRPVGNPDPAPRTIALGRGVVVPYPEPADAAATKIGRANRRTDTKAEVALRSTLHRRGLRFRKDHLIRCMNGVKVRPDVVFTRALVAVFVDGCFWHGCPDHQNIPKRNIDYWVPKLLANVERDRRADDALAADGWHIERVWEHEDPDAAADRISAAVAERRANPGQARRS
jgi:DNA mismatch endonuclease (patch repair protein)